MSMTLVLQIVLVAIVLVLVFGLINMVWRRDSNMSQQLMRWRVVLQLVAILLILALLYLRQNGGG